MSKAIAERSNGLSIFWLKKYGYLQKGGGFKSGGIKWTYGSSESSIGFVVTTNMQDISGEDDNIRLQYAQADRWSGKKENLDYKIRLTTTSCNYGGVRYWFICPLSKNRIYCGRRVGVLYNIDKYYGCRRCGEIAYYSQRRGGRFRGSSVSFPDIKRVEKEIKRYYYKGKPTRKYKRLIRMRNKLNNDFMGFAFKSFK